MRLYLCNLESREMTLIQFIVASCSPHKGKRRFPPYLSLTMHGWITPRNHELFNFHLEKLSARSSYYERICSIGYNSHLDGSLHLLEGIRAEAFNKRLNLSDKWDKCIHDLFLLFAALIPSEGIPLCVPAEKWDILTPRKKKKRRGPFGAAGRQFTVESN